MTNQLPDGYTIYDKGGNYVIVGMYNFSLMFAEAEPTIVVDGVTYHRDVIEAIPRDVVGCFCSMRRYIIK